ncbi:dihydroorotase [Marinobacteraceae bacterium S3BR75-40.1]
MMSLRIDKVRLLDENGIGQTEHSVLVEGGRIASLDAGGQTADEVVDGRGQWLMPGLIDLCCNLREPGDNRKGNIATETRAAARGGFTTVCASPETVPVNDSGAVTGLIRGQAAERGVVRVLPIGAMTRGMHGELLSDMAALHGAGCVALSNGNQPVRDARILRRCMAYAATFDIPLFLRPENASLAADGCAHEGFIATRLGLPGIPEVAETAAVSELILLAEDTGVRLHLSQLSAARSVELVADARRRGLAVTADVAVHHLLFTEALLEGYDSRFHLRPPLRTEQDRAGLLQGVRDGTLSAIVSQHEPQDPEAKQAPFGETAPGLSSIELVLPLLQRLVDDGALAPEHLYRALCLGPSGILGQPRPVIAEGAVADLCLYDPSASWTVNDRGLLSQSKQTACSGEEVRGRVRLTLVDGRVAYRDPV